MKKKILAIILALAITGGLLAAFAAVASSDQLFDFELETPLCPRCHWPMRLTGQSKDKCDWQCTNKDCPDSQKGSISMDHAWRKNVITEPDCSTKTDGLYRLKCKYCGEQKYVTVPATHKAVVDPGVEPTCTEPGLTPGSHCGVCGDVIQPRIVLLPLGHDLKDVKVIKAPTCEEAGTETGVCTRCGSTVTQAIPPLGHMITHDDPVEPTCTKPGKSEGQHCENCGKVLVDPQIIPALGHDYKVEKLEAPTCTKDGKKIEVCTRCGDKKETVLKAEHQYVKFPFNGREYLVCKACGDLRFVSPKTKSTTLADKIRDLADETVYSGTGALYGKEIDDNTRFKLVPVSDGLYQCCIDEKPGSDKPQLFRLPMYFVVPDIEHPDKAAAKSVKFEISKDDIDSKNLDDGFSSIFLVGKDKFEYPDFKETKEKYTFETKTPGFLATLKDSTIKGLNKDVEKLKKDK